VGHCIVEGEFHDTGQRGQKGKRPLADGLAPAGEAHHTLQAVIVHDRDKSAEAHIGSRGGFKD
jgi:hypothetical protein